MNYAEDRLDRRARHVVSSSTSGLVADWKRGLELVKQEKEHELLGKTLRDAGWCRHATFHYAMAWIHDPSNPTAAGDYAQMAELAGFPEVGVLALLYYRARGELQEQVALHAQTNGPQQPCRDASSAAQLPFPSKSHCGCGFSDCGQYVCYIPMLGLKPIVSSLEEYSRFNDQSTNMPTASDILTALAKGKEPPFNKDTDKLLQFWSTDVSSSDYRPLEPVLQLLLLKLLYLTIPSLASEAVARLRFDNPRELAKLYKSHWAYYVLVHAVVLGERIKPHRRLLVPYHVPVWDLVWDLDQRNMSDGDNPIMLENWFENGDNDATWDRLDECITSCRWRRRDDDQDQPKLPTTWWHRQPNGLNYKPLFIMGDSHVLSLAWQTIFVPSPRLAVPVVTTGLKAWHTKPDTRFFTRYLLTTCFDRLPSSCRTILFSAGEIDCREGIGGSRLEGYNKDCHDQLKRTASEYVYALSGIAKHRNLQILVLPVAPHAHRSQRNGKSTGRAFRRQAMETWNQQLRETLPCNGVYFLDYETCLRQGNTSEYVLKPAFNADYTHMNSAFLPHLEHALQNCDCDLNLI